MGAVYRCRDPLLNRELAVKLVLDRHADRGDVLRRFAEEARVTGRLQHPGVVPVHDYGTLPDGRPFLAMKLIKGRTLAELLRGRPDPAHDLPHFLNDFRQVCQAVGYAHSRGVIHRDLKPSNVMVGAFGEVQVMDWGLAKALGDAAPQTRGGDDGPAGSVVDALRPAGAADTQAGSVLGTLAYMPPEQALGEVDRIDRRADVFGLGAILCEVLTGRPPYAADSAEEVTRMARRGALADAPARLGGCGADAELVALARSCLAAEPATAPPDGGAVADTLAAYLAGVQERLRHAEVERAAAEARAAAERRRRR